MYRLFFKRFFDFSISFVGLICVSPLLLVVSIWLHFANKGTGVFFFQERPGKNSKIFKIWKFKSMTDERDIDGNLLPDEQRITRAGAFVRKSSIDELPQLWNVLKGDMSLIGPRPLLPRYLPYYTETEKHRHDVRPGITGLAQVNGRNCVSWDEKLDYDVQYVNNISFINDCKILIKTIQNIMHGKDIQIVPTGEFLDIERANKNANIDM